MRRNVMPLMTVALASAVLAPLPAGAASRPITLAGMLMLMTEQGNLVGLR